MNWFTGESKETKQLKTQKKAQEKFLAGFKQIIDNASAADETVRSRFSRLVSGGYDFGDILHQIYEDFGYPETLGFSNYWNMYRRFGPAQAVCEIPVDITWLEVPEVDGGAEFNTAFEALVEKTKLWKKLKGVDNRQRVGRYAGLFVRVKDGQKPDKEVTSLSSLENIASLTPLYESQLVVATTDNDPKSPDFGNPITYDFNGAVVGNRNEEQVTSFQIHKSRVIIWAEGADDGSIYGKSAIESVYNDLMDLRKISGSGGEGFYQNTRNAPVINTKEEYEAPTGQDKLDLENEIDEFLNKWRKKFVAQGLEFDYPDITLDNPKPFYDNSMNNISAGAKIPSKLINGNQTGKLAGDGDNKHFLTLMNSRRENFAAEGIELTILWFVEHNILPEPVNLTIEWDDLLAQSDKEGLELGKFMSETNRNQFQAGGEHVYSPEQIAETSGFDFEEVELPDETLEEDEMDDNEVIEDES